MEAGKQQRQLPFHVLSWNGEKGRVLAEEMSAYNGYETSSGIGYPTPGSFGSYIEAKGIAMVTLEMPVADAAACWTHNRAALLAAIHLPWIGPPRTSMENDQRLSGRRTGKRSSPRFDCRESATGPRKILATSRQQLIGSAHQNPCSTIDERNFAQTRMHPRPFGGQ